MASPDHPIIRRKRPWALTFFGLLSIAGLVAMPILAGEASEVVMPDWVRFLGHFHPVLLHLPIGVFALLLVQELGGVFGRRREDSDECSLFPMFFGAASAIVAVIAGFLLYHGHGDEYLSEPLAERHLWGGLVFAVAAVLTLIVKAWTVALGANPAWYRLLFFGSVGVMGFASHDGASMTHGKDYLTRYAPNRVRRILGLEDKPAAAPAVVATGDQVVYADIIAPILERRCVACHKEGKSKGKLRMDSYEFLLKGGKEGPAIEPGNANDSNIIVRIALPLDDDEHMPTDGKPEMETDELLVLKWWLDSGADPELKLGDANVPEEVQTALGGVKVVDASTEQSAVGHAEAPVAIGPDESLKAVVSGLAKDFPGAVSFESQGSSAVTFTAVSLRGKMDDAGFAKLKPILPNLVSVDLSATQITDQSVLALVAAKDLRMVRLAETGVTDAAIDSLVKLESLESLNLYGTKVTDAGIAKLAGLPKLKHLYLWQTAVTPAGAKSLQDKLPDCEIVTGAESSADGQNVRDTKPSE